MIKVFTKPRHKNKIHRFLSSIDVPHEIYTVKDNVLSSDAFALGVSYCYPRKIKEPLLSTPVGGFINYHPAPLPCYKGPNELQNAIDNHELRWGVTVHYMDENYDTGPVITSRQINLHEAPSSKSELGAVSHYFLFELFKDTIEKILLSKPV